MHLASRRLGHVQSLDVALLARNYHRMIAAAYDWHAENVFSLFFVLSTSTFPLSAELEIRPCKKTVWFHAAEG